MEYFMEDQRVIDKEEGELTSNDEDDYNSLLKDIIARENVRMGQEHIRSPNSFSKGESFVSGRMKCSRKRRKRHREHSQEHQSHKSLSESRNGTLSQLKYQQSSASSGRSILKHKKSVKMTSSPSLHKHQRHNSRGDNMEVLESPQWEQEYEDPSYYQNEKKQTDRDNGSRSGHWSNDRKFTLPELHKLRNEGSEFRKNTAFGRTNTGKTSWQENDMHQMDETILQTESRISEYSYTERLVRFRDSLEKKHICKDVCQERQRRDAEQVQECQKFLKKIKELAEYNPKLALDKLMKFHKSWHGTGRHIVSDLIQELQNVLHKSRANNTFHGGLKDLDEAHQKPLLTCNNHDRYEKEFAFVPNFRSEEPRPGEEVSSVGRPHNDEQCYPNLSCQRFRQHPSPRFHSLYEVNSTGNSPAFCQNAILFYNTTVNTPAQQRSPQFVFVPLIQPPLLGQATVTREEQFEDTRKVEILDNRIIVNKGSNSDLMDNENLSPFHQDYKFSDRNLTQRGGVFRELSCSHLRFPYQTQRHGSARQKQNERARNESLHRPVNMHQKASEERVLNVHFREKITPHNAFTRTDNSSSSEENISTEKSHQVPVNERKVLFANRHIDNFVPSTKTVSACENYETNNQVKSSYLTSNISIQNIPHKKLYSPHNTPNKRFVRNNFNNGHADQMRSREVENGSVLAVTPYNAKRTLLPTPKYVYRSYVRHKRQRFRKCSRKTVRNKSLSVAHSSEPSDQRSPCSLQVWPAVDDSCAEATPTYCPPVKKMKYSSPLCDNTVQIVPSIELTENMNNCDLKQDTDSEDEASVLRRKLLEDREKRKRSTENHSVQLTEASSSVEQDNMNLQPADVTGVGEQLVMKQLIDDQKSSQIREEDEGTCPPFSAFSNNFNNITLLQPLSESCKIEVEYYQRDEFNGDEVKCHLGCLLKKEFSQSGSFETCQTVQV